MCPSHPFNANFVLSQLRGIEIALSTYVCVYPSVQVSVRPDFLSTLMPAFLNGVLEVTSILYGQNRIAGHRST